MRTRLELDTILRTILGSNKVYYQAPIKLEYPCILYERADIFNENANNKKYQKMTRYTITYITKSASHEIVMNKLLDLDYCSFNRQFINDNLYHLVFDLYF